MPDHNALDEQEEEHILKYLDGLGMTRLNGEAISKLAADINEEEVDRALPSLKGNKAPVLDRFNGTYYKTFRSLRLI
ncbi:Hypothetical predicted protein [Pelobates cultripes]|uniref:Uncharacterized protein n=1 Tax=Pelobates cultripes TaxID=61616 RepID=A0AAD1SGQ6_PELCU|nr:Hypothetical predicted protein [Pelobates cultripes]